MRTPLRTTGVRVLTQLASGSRHVPAELEDTVTLSSALARAPRQLQRQLLDRMVVLLDGLGHPLPPSHGSKELVQAVHAALTGADGARMWLALSVLTGLLPLDSDVVAAHRRLELDGPGVALGPPVAAVLATVASHSRTLPQVEVLHAAVVVDMHHTSQTELATGIQRVARETVRRWNRDHDITLLGWTEGYTALRRLDDRSARQALGEPAATEPAAATHDPETPPAVVVPWCGTYTIVELATEEPRTRRMQSLARWSGNRTGMVGHDCVPLTSSETTAESMGGAFAGLLAGVRHMDRVATVSEASATEYRGWRAMLVGTGWPGPQITAVPLAVAASVAPPEAVERARSRFCLGSLPLVLSIGSHEPRKNHLAVLHAAELLWRQGLTFSLLFVGGNAWHSERFTATLGTLRAGGRAVESVSGLSDEMLWAAYQVAHVMLFPSLSEGFGLPVAEALASGTPVITTGYGSTAETAAHGGCLLVDPRDDHDIAAALERVLTDAALHEELATQARQVPLRAWDDYARDLWNELVVRPASAGVNAC